jgi:hypothetical protein
MAESVPPSTVCACGSGQSFATCHGADIPAENTFSGDEKASYTAGYWLVAFVDLLGQKEAFLRTDYLPKTADAEKVNAFIAEVRASTGVILNMRKFLSMFRTGLAGGTDVLDDLSPEQREVADRLRKTRVREFRISDGVILACPLMPEDGHYPIRGVYEVLATCVFLMSAQLAAGRPIRGGIDVGTGIEIDGELFGSALVKAYVLESNIAKHPRLVVGQDLVNYLNTSRQSPLSGIEGQYERKMAADGLQLFKQDVDQQWIVDYAGPTARQRLPLLINMLKPAAEFARRARADFQLRSDAEGRKLFDRYSTLVRYLEASGHV